MYDSLVGTVKESYLLQLSVVLYTFGSARRPPDGDPDDMRPRQPIPGREPIHLAERAREREPTASEHNRGVGSANVKRALHM